MKLDRNSNDDQMGKYALVRLREIHTNDEAMMALMRLVELGFASYGMTAEDEFFVMKLKDKHAGIALIAYAAVAAADDAEYSREILDLAIRALRHPLKKSPD